MQPNLEDILTQLSKAQISVQEAARQIRLAPYQEMQGVCLDLQRRQRTGLGEVVYARGKSQEQLQQAVSGLWAAKDPVLVTKLEPEQGNFLQQEFPQGEYWPQPGLFVLGRKLDLEPPWSGQGRICIVTAGSSDLPVALEALGSAEFYGLQAGLICDVGVAGLHRITPYLSQLADSRLLIVVAGMEGALPSVLGGMLGKPTIAVPTSVGYGASFSGLSSLLGMLNTCAPGIAVVNIDNGFGAAVLALKLTQAFEQQ
ncbi:MAG: nickel pincer cofactor biosynthesis protein LarB [Desulfohalobiaceae bacterium]